jgi:hypothetical protein
VTPRTTRADRLAHPTTRDAVRAVAEACGACLHPVQLRRINTDTGGPARLKLLIRAPTAPPRLDP